MSIVFLTNVALRLNILQNMFIYNKNPLLIEGVILYVESEQNYVAVFHDIFLAFKTHKSFFFCGEH